MQNPNLQKSVHIFSVLAPPQQTEARLRQVRAPISQLPDTAITQLESFQRRKQTIGHEGDAREGRRRQ